MPLLAQKYSHSVAAFSLVEVVIAIGVFSLAFISVVGLFPAGLNSLHASMNSTTEGQLVQYIASTTSLSSFTNADQPTTNYFGQDGRCLTNSTDANIRYRVVTQPLTTSLPGTGVFSTNDAICLRVTIFQQAGPSGPSLGSNVYTIQVTNSGK